MSLASYFNLIYAFLFLPIVVLIYHFTPKGFRYFILLLASFVFFFLISANLIIFLILSILSIYISTCSMMKLEEKKNLELETTEKENRKLVKQKYNRNKKIVLVLCILFNVSFLFCFKYLNFFILNLNSILDCFPIELSFSMVRWIAPIGISFYTLQALSYVIDVYHGKVEAERNVFKVALFLSFFPQIIEGPIVRYSDTANSLQEGKPITYHNLCYGYQRILFGFFKKVIIADRLNILVKIIFESYMNYSGISVLLGVIGYTIMLYMEFSGTMDVVIGSGEIFGIQIPENFRQPFFSKNISEFWTRWHISLGLWFKDYIFYPVSLSKPMKKLTVKARKLLGNHYGPLLSGSFALFVVWFLNGLWHGAGWNYLFFGLYQFIMILMGSLIEPIIKKVCLIFHINRSHIVYRVFQSIKMTMFVFIGELFFRAPTVTIAFQMLKKIVTNFNVLAFKNGELLSLGLDGKDYLVLLVALIFIFVISLLREKKISIRDRISSQNIFVRWTLYYAFILAILVFGAYGSGYIPVDPIYADF